MGRCVAILASVTALALPAAASAAAPFTVGTGYGPDLAVGSDGAGHVVWITDEANDRLGYCRVPAGASACDRTQFLEFPLPGPLGVQALSHSVQVFTPVPGKVVLVGACYQCGADDAANRVWRWISTDNGATFSAGPVQIGTAALGGRGAWIESTGVFVGPAGGNLQAMAEPFTPFTTMVNFASGSTYSQAIAQVPGSPKLVAATNNLADVKFGVYTGATSDAAAINNQTNWLIDQLLGAPEGRNDETALNTGPNGLFLTYRFVQPNNEHVGLRKFDPATNTFSVPVYVERASPIDNSALYPDSFQDAGGRIHVVWNSRFDDGRLRYTVSDAAVSTFTLPANLAIKEGFIDPVVAAGPDAKGFAAWRGPAASPIRVVLLDPQPEPTATPPSTPVGTTPVPVGRRKTVSVAGATITFATPRQCVPPGGRFRVTLTWKRKRRKGNVFVKVYRSDFYIGAKRVKIDRKAPFRQTLTVVATQPAGSAITVRARAFIKVKRGKAPKKSIRARVRVCA